MFVCLCVLGLELFIEKKTIWSGGSKWATYHTSAHTHKHHSMGYVDGRGRLQYTPLVMMPTGRSLAWAPQTYRLSSVFVCVYEDDGIRWDLKEVHHSPTRRRAHTFPLLLGVLPNPAAVEERKEETKKANQLTRHIINVNHFFTNIYLRLASPASSARLRPSTESPFDPII